MQTTLTDPTNLVEITHCRRLNRFSRNKGQTLGHTSNNLQSVSPRRSSLSGDTRTPEGAGKRQECAGDYRCGQHDNERLQTSRPNQNTVWHANSEAVRHYCADLHELIHSWSHPVSQNSRAVHTLAFAVPSIRSTSAYSSLSGSLGSCPRTVGMMLSHIYEVKP